MKVAATTVLTHHTQSSHLNNGGSNTAAAKYLLNELGVVKEFNSAEEMIDYLSSNYSIPGTIENTIKYKKNISITIENYSIDLNYYIKVYDGDNRFLEEQTVMKGPKQEYSPLDTKHEFLNSFDNGEYDNLSSSEIEEAKKSPLSRTITEIKNRQDHADYKPENFIRNNSFGLYLENILVKEVNRDGKPPLWLRPFAAICEFFGFYGVGQTNCVSCATSVSDTFRTNILHRAMPELRGADIRVHSSIGLKVPKVCKTTRKLAEYLGQTSDNINDVLVIHRPKNWLRSIFSPTIGHACNIIKINKDIYLVDAQKRSFFHYNCDSQKNELEKGLHKFIGPVIEDGLDLYNVDFSEQISRLISS